MTIMQGDAYSIPFVISYGDLTITPEMVSKIEIMVGEITKFYPAEIRYDDELKVFNFPLTQNETMELNSGQTVQIRCLFKSGDVKGIILDKIRVTKGNSRNILEAD